MRTQSSISWFKSIAVTLLSNMVTGKSGSWPTKWSLSSPMHYCNWETKWNSPEKENPFIDDSFSWLSVADSVQSKTPRLVKIPNVKYYLKIPSTDLCRMNILPFNSPDSKPVIYLSAKFTFLFTPTLYYLTVKYKNQKLVF